MSLTQPGFLSLSRSAITESCINMFAVRRRRRRVQRDRDQPGVEGRRGRRRQQPGVQVVDVIGKRQLDVVGIVAVDLHERGVKLLRGTPPASLHTPAHCVPQPHPALSMHPVAEKLRTCLHKRSPHGGIAVIVIHLRVQQDRKRWR